MESNEWDSILQFVSDGIAHGTPLPLEKHAAVDRSVLSASIATPQVPTPPASSNGTPDDEREQNMLVSVSTTFFPGANLDPRPADVVILSSDSVFFYANTHRLLSMSDNGFNSLLSKVKASDADDCPIISVPEHSTVLNVLLHTMYHMSVSHYAPTVESVLEAVDRMYVYGMTVTTHIAPSTPLFQLLLATAATYPIEIYACAASFDIHDLAVPVSLHLLSYQLSSLTDEIAAKIGPFYLRRLFFLHLGRIEALKRLLLPPPSSHLPTYACDAGEQKKITRAWALASAYLAWDARPDLSTTSIEAALCPLGERLACEECRRLLRERITNLVFQWSLVKKTI